MFECVVDCEPVDFRTDTGADRTVPSYRRERTDATRLTPFVVWSTHPVREMCAHITATRASAHFQSRRSASTLRRRRFPEAFGFQFVEGARVQCRRHSSCFRHRAEHMIAACECVYAVRLCPCLCALVFVCGQNERDGYSGRKVGGVVCGSGDGRLCLQARNVVFGSRTWGTEPTGWREAGGWRRADSDGCKSGRNVPGRARNRWKVDDRGGRVQCWDGFVGEAVPVVSRSSVMKFVCARRVKVMGKRYTCAALGCVRCVLFAG